MMRSATRVKGRSEKMLTCKVESEGLLLEEAEVLNRLFLLSCRLMHLELRN